MDEQVRPRSRDRRSVLSALATSVGVGGLGAIGASRALADGTDGTVEISIADGAGDSSLAFREHCAIGRDRCLERDLEVGDQLRLETPEGELDGGVYTLVETLSERETVRLGPAGADRLGVADGTTGVVRAGVPHPEYETDAEAAANDEFVERLSDDGENDGLAVLAPHGGRIEYRTDEQADRVADRLGATASAWTCAGYNSGGGAYDRWHVTSTDLSRRSFPRLDRIADRGFAHAVSFHGFSRSGILIGGAAPKRVKRAVRHEISCAVSDSYEVSIANRNDPYSGTSADNVVNRLAADGGVQIEQSFAARSDDWQPIADAVATAFEGLLASESKSGSKRSRRRC